MGYFLKVLSVVFLISSESFAVSLPSSNLQPMGGVTNNSSLQVTEGNSQGYFTIYSSGQIVTANQYSPFYKNGVQYQVTAGKSFSVVKICIATGLAAGQSGFNNFFQLLSATASFNPNASSVTGGVYQSGAATGGHSLAVLSAAPYAYACFDTTYSFAASTYPGWSPVTSGSHSLIVTGKEI